MIEEPTPVNLGDIYAMSGQVSYAYVGEPHIDSYEGAAFIDVISLWLPATTPVRHSSWGKIKTRYESKPASEGDQEPK